MSSGTRGGAAGEREGVSQHLERQLETGVIQTGQLRHELIDLPSPRSGFRIEPGAELEQFWQGDTKRLSQSARRFDTGAVGSAFDVADGVHRAFDPRGEVFLGEPLRLAQSLHPSAERALQIIDIHDPSIVRRAC